MNPANLVTMVRTVASLVVCLIGITHRDLSTLLIGLAIYWVGDMADGAVARWRKCETRLGATFDIACDRLNSCLLYVGLIALEPDYAVPVAIYLTSFVGVDTVLSCLFLTRPVLSPNYYYEVDQTMWRWNWSKPAKALNSALFAVVLVATGWVVAASLFATMLLILKSVFLARAARQGLFEVSASIG